MRILLENAEGSYCRLVYDTCITSTHKYTIQISVITNWFVLLFNTFWFDYRFSGSYRKHVMAAHSHQVNVAIMP